MEFLFYTLLILAGIIFIYGMRVTIQEQKKYIDRPADLAAKRKETTGVMAFFVTLCLIGAYWAHDNIPSPPIIDRSSGSTSPVTETAPENGVVTAVVEKNDAPVSSNWRYKEDVDPMTNVTDYYASIEANGLLQFKSPYEGGSIATITIRHQAKHNSVCLSVDKGQFMSSIDGAAIRVKFDDGKPTVFGCSEPTDGSSNTLFVDEPARLIAKMKNAKRLMVQALFYEEGRQTMEFAIQELKWTH